MKWVLINKRETQARRNYNCEDCKKKIPAGSYVKRYTFKNDEKYDTRKLCIDCEKYYQREDLKYEERN